MPGAPKNNDVESEAKQLKRSLEGWKDIVVEAESVLTWERSAYPGVILGVTSLTFLLLWYMDLSFLTTVSMIGLFLAIADYLVPILSAKFFGESSWSGNKEKRLEVICYQLAAWKLSFTQHVICYATMRNSQPIKFYLITVVTLLFLSWIGNSVSNLLLTYLAVTILLMIPGLSKRGWLDPVRRVMAMVCCGGKEVTKKLD